MKGKTYKYISVLYMKMISTIVLIIIIMLGLIGSVVKFGMLTIPTIIVFILLLCVVLYLFMTVHVTLPIPTPTKIFSQTSSATKSTEKALDILSTNTRQQTSSDTTSTRTPPPATTETIKNLTDQTTTVEPSDSPSSLLPRPSITTQTTQTTQTTLTTTAPVADPITTNPKQVAEPTTLTTTPTTTTTAPVANPTTTTPKQVAEPTTLTTTPTTTPTTTTITPVAESTTTPPKQVAEPTTITNPTVAKPTFVKTKPLDTWYQQSYIELSDIGKDAKSPSIVSQSETSTGWKFVCEWVWPDEWNRVMVSGYQPDNITNHFTSGDALDILKRIPMLYRPILTLVSASNMFGLGVWFVTGMTTSSYEIKQTLLKINIPSYQKGFFTFVSSNYVPKGSTIYSYNGLHLTLYYAIGRFIANDTSTSVRQDWIDTTSNEPILSSAAKNNAVDDMCEFAMLHASCLMLSLIHI
jgi:hypothetical protein